MAHATQLTFVHRDNADGTTSSFCLQCLATIAKKPWEADLDAAELNHLCDSDRMDYMRILSDSIFRKGLMDVRRKLMDSAR
jgi:hypothetical protein